VLLASLPLDLPAVSNSRLEWIFKIPILNTIAANFSYWKNSRRMNRQLFVLHEKKLTYLRILKCASTSMLKELLPEIEPGVRNLNLSGEVVDALSFYYVRNKTNQDYDSFAIVRNPFQRIVSAYLDLFDPTSPAFTYDSYWFGVLNREMSFREFINVISRIPVRRLGPHFTPQKEIINSSGLRRVKVFHLDKNLDSLKSFLGEYNLKLQLNNPSPVPYQLKDYYDSSVLEKVLMIYQEDVVTFNYTSEYEWLRKEVSSVSDAMK
jgi:hypothetical protein